MSRSALLSRQDVRACLEKRDLSAVVEQAAERGATSRAVVSLLFDPEPIIRWRAIETLGLSAARTSHRGLEKVRRQLRNLLWLMNDESGGLCWMAPEAIGEIVYRVPQLLDEYGPLLPQFFDEEPFERGSRWGVARLAPLKPELFAPVVPRLLGSLSDADPVVRGYSLLALGALGKGGGPNEAITLKNDMAAVPVYDFESGVLEAVSVGELARRYSGKSSSA